MELSLAGRRIVETINPQAELEGMELAGCYVIVTDVPEERPSNTSWVRAADLLDPKSPALVSARNAGYTTAIGFPMTNVFAGQGSAYNLAGARAGRMVVGDPVGQMITLPASGFGGPFPGSLMGILSYVRQI